MNAQAMVAQAMDQQALIAYSREGAKHTEIAKSRIGSFIA